MMKFVMRGSNKVAPLAMIPQGEAIEDPSEVSDVKKMPLREESVFSDGGLTADTEQSLSSRSSQSLASISDNEEEESGKEEVQSTIKDVNNVRQSDEPLPKLVQVPEEEPLPSLEQIFAPSPPMEVKTPPPAPSRSSLPPRPRHRRTSSAMPRLETLHEGKAMNLSEKPPLPPKRMVSPPQNASYKDPLGPGKLTRVQSLQNLNSKKSVPNYPSASSNGPQKPHHRRTHSAPSKQPEDLYSVPSLLQQLKQLQQQYGEQHAMVATTWNWLGNAYFRQGNMEAALQAYKKAVLCEPGEHLADAYANMGTVHWASGNVEEAIPLLQNALSVHEYNVMSRGQDPNTSLPVAAVQYQLGLALTLHKDYDQALHSLNQARVIREIVFGHNHMDVARTLDAMGKAYLLQGNHPQALDCHLQALAIKESFPPHVASTAVVVTMTHIAGVYRAMNNLVVAGVWMHRLLAHQKNEFMVLKTKALCADIGVTLTTLGDIYQSASQNREALSCYQEAEMYLAKAHVPENDPRRAMLSEYLSLR